MPYLHSAQPMSSVAEQRGGGEGWGYQRPYGKSLFRAIVVRNRNLFTSFYFSVFFSSFFSLFLPPIHLMPNLKKAIPISYVDRIAE